jgi:hypothetical protein
MIFEQYGIEKMTAAPGNPGAERLSRPVFPKEAAAIREAGRP